MTGRGGDRSNLLLALEETKSNFGLYRLAQATALATFCLIFVGGMVTSRDAGLSVPDWPLSFGSINPPGWWHMDLVRLEHGHRLFAAAVGILTSVLTVMVFLKDDRRSVKTLALCAFIGVCLQGLLGGLRVTQLSSVLAMAHACVGQAFFCVVLSLAVVLAPGWRRSDWVCFAHNLPLIRKMSWVMVAVVYCQLIIGAVVRHMKAGLAIPDFPLAFGKIIPPLPSTPIAIHFAHRLGAVVVICVAIMLIAVVFWNARNDKRLIIPALAIGSLVILQVALGAHIIWLRKAPLPTTLHVVNGAAVLGSSLFLALRAGRLTSGAFRVNGCILPELSEVAA